MTEFQLTLQEHRWCLKMAEAEASERLLDLPFSRSMMPFTDTIVTNSVYVFLGDFWTPDCDFDFRLSVEPYSASIAMLAEVILVTSAKESQGLSVIDVNTGSSLCTRFKNCIADKGTMALIGNSLSSFSG